MTATDPEGDPLSVRWVLQADPVTTNLGADAEDEPPVPPHDQLERRVVAVREPAGLTE